MIESHQWKNRVLLILANSADNQILTEQIEEFNKNRKGLTERKLIVFQIQKDGYLVGLEANTKFHKTSGLYESYIKDHSPYEIILIGLDGGIKLRQKELLSLDKLFAIIDGMPMRRAEMKEQQ
jgi:hypothetical protein